MLKKVIYTLWVDDDFNDPMLLDDESIYKTKRNAFKRAKQLLRRPSYNGCKILVRKIYFNHNDLPEEDCVEWSFSEEDL